MGITNLFRLIAVLPHNPQIFFRLIFLETLFLLRTPFLPGNAKYAEQKKDTNTSNDDGELHINALSL